MEMFLHCVQKPSPIFFTCLGIRTFLIVESWNGGEPVDVNPKNLSSLNASIKVFLLNLLDSEVIRHSSLHTLVL